MIGTCGWRARMAATMRCVGSTTQRSNWRGERLPAQESNNCTASAPASIWPDRYPIELSTMASMISPKATGSRYAIARAR
jgi:hypothetical protein